MVKLLKNIFFFVVIFRHITRLVIGRIDFFLAGAFGSKIAYSFVLATVSVLGES